MRIGMMLDVYSANVSGVTNHVRLNKQQMEAWGHEVCVFAFDDKEKPPSEEGVYLSPGFRIQKSYYTGLALTDEAAEMLCSMDIVHVHHPFVAGPLAINYCKDRRIPLVFTNHTRYDLYMRAYAPWLPPGVSWAFLRAYLPTFARKMRRVIAPSAGMETVLREWGVTGRVEIIPNGINLKPFQDARSRRGRAELGFSDDTIVWVYSGRMAPEKNLFFLLEAFEQVAATQPRAGLLMVGGGILLDRLRAWVAERQLQHQVRFTGLVPYESLPGYVQAGDAFATASVTEVHPLTVIEAMASGLPVLGVRSPGVADTIEPEVSGLLTQPDLAEFTAAMDRLTADADLRRRLSAGAAEAAEDYAIERTARTLLSEYEAVLAEPVSRSTKTSPLA